MAQRNPFMTDMSVRVQEAGVSFKSKKFLKAFNQYKAVYDEESVSSGYLKLFLRTRMLCCQYNKKMIAADVVISRAQAIAGELIKAISQDAQHKAIFEGCLNEMRVIVLALSRAEKKIAYLIKLTENALELSDDEKFSDYADMMELDAGKYTYEADYLDMLCTQLKEMGIRSRLVPRLLAAIGSLYSNYAQPETGVEAKLLQLKYARENFKCALLESRILNDVDGDQVLVLMLSVLQDIYELAKSQNNDADRAAAFRDVNIILASAEFKRLSASAELGFEDEIKDYQKWFLTISETIKNERNDKLDRLLMPPPAQPYKARRIGLDIYVNPQAVVRSDVVSQPIQLTI